MEYPITFWILAGLNLLALICCHSSFKRAECSAAGELNQMDGKIIELPYRESYWVMPEHLLLESIRVCGMKNRCTPGWNAW
jgi:hypothetical protein